LAPAFAFLSTANPSSLGSIERAAGYAVPLLQSGLEVDPIQTLLLGTALTRAGATNTKSGTWLREMALRAMPGTSMMSKMAFKKHEEALKEIGLVDENGKPTWFTDGKPDLLKMLDIGGTNAQKIPIERRAALERSLFGAQGGGGFALLADPAVRDQVLSLQKEMNSPEFKNRYGTFAESYRQGSTLQNARTVLAEANNLLMDLGQHALPTFNGALRDLSNVIRRIRGDAPLATDGKWGVGATAVEGAVVGAGVGAFAGGVGAVPGAALGAIAGGVLAGAHDYMAQQHDAKERPGDRYQHRIERLEKAKVPPVTLNLNIDGRALAQATSTAMGDLTSFPTGAPSADGMGQFYSGDHNYPDN
jgi:hypothetical protein